MTEKQELMKLSLQVVADSAALIAKLSERLRLARRGDV